ncbi:MAG: HAD family hydrolase [Akkermansia sp.]|nr:HAD family hydrolase [Akkermansia sp.]
MKRHIVFDLDGTLVDSLPGIAEGVNRSLQALGLPTLSREAISRMIGSGAANLCGKALGYEDAAHTPPDKLEAMHAEFRRHYPQCWQYPLTRAYPWVANMLTLLSAEGAELAVLSNKPHDVTEPMVRAIFPHIPFSCIMGYSGKFPRKPAPDSLQHIASTWGIPTGEITLVGDSLFDARTAINAGCEMVLVAWGYADVAELAALQVPIFGSVDELRHYLLNS